MKVKSLVCAAGVVLSPALGAAEDAPGPFVIASSPALEIRLSGRVHRMIQVVEDGRETSAFFTDSAQGPTIFRFDVTGKASDSLSVGGVLEIGVQQNNPVFVSQDAPDAGIDVSGRVAEIFVESATLGRFGLGRGFAAAWVAPEIDLSGTVFASLLPVGNLFPGLKFVNADTKELTETRVLSHFADLERLLLADRFRYDSPRFGGFRVSGSVAADSRWDVALRARRSPGDFTLSGATTYQHEPFRDVRWRWDAGLSARHEPTGLNLTVAGSVQDHDDGRQSQGFIVKGGWLTSWFPIGKTALSVDYTRNTDVAVAGSEGRSVGAVILQNWERFGVRFYAGVRRFSVEEPAVALEPLTVFPFFGALIAF
jgi:hypothetical protein